MEGYRIGQAAEAIGVRVETLRRWERDGKLTTARTSGGQRLCPGRARSPGCSRSGEPSAHRPRPSRRNAFPGVITKVTRDKVSALVEIQAGPHRVVSLITREAADELDLQAGDGGRRHREGDERDGRGPPVSEATARARPSDAPRSGSAGEATGAVADLGVMVPLAAA